MKTIEEIKEYAKQNNVPIMEDEGLNFLCMQIEKYACKKILEVGTAIGYSAIQICLYNDEITVVSIERDEVRYKEAVQNVLDFGLEDRITLIFGDALEVEVERNDFDLVFIDAAKAQYTKFFDKYTKNLKTSGIVVSDNLDFHGMVRSDSPAPTRNVRQLVRKIKGYIAYLQEHEAYDTTFYEVGDGIAISVPKI